MAALVLINFRARNIDAQDTALRTSRTHAIFRYMRVRRSLLSLIFLSPVAIARVDAELVKFLLRVRGWAFRNFQLPSLQDNPTLRLAALTQVRNTR